MRDIGKEGKEEKKGGRTKFPLLSEECARMCERGGGWGEGGGRNGGKMVLRIVTKERGGKKEVGVK